MSRRKPDRHLGYEIHWQNAMPPRYQLEAYLCTSPSYKHFDPEEMRVLVASSQEIDILHVHHPISRPDSYRACAGRVTLCDRHAETVCFFTFGGDLSVQPTGDFTHCLLTSPAPIVELCTHQSALVLLAVEAEVLLAQRRAAWSRQRGAFNGRLACADPFILYAACLERLRHRFEAFPRSAQDQSIQDFIRFLHTTIRQLQQRPEWPAVTPQLEDLL